MTQKITEIVCLLERSGSMSGLEADTIGGFNQLIKKQNELPGQTRLTTILFDHKIDLLWDFVNASDVQLTEYDYFVRGYPALLDAIGKTIVTVQQCLLENSN